MISQKYEKILKRKFFGWCVQKDYDLHLSFLQNIYQFCLRKAPKHQLNRN